MIKQNKIFFNILFFSLCCLFQTSFAASDLEKMNIKGKVVSIKEIKKDDSYDLTLFNDEGNIDSTASYMSGGTKQSETLFTYDDTLYRDKTVLVKEIDFSRKMNDEMELTSETTYAYNRSGHLFKREYRHIRSNTITNMEISYDLNNSDKGLKLLESYYSKGILEDRIKYTYNENDQLIKREQFGGGVLYYVYVTKYNDAGNKESLSLLDGEGKLLQETTYNEKLEESGITHYEGSNSTETNTYTYDKQGNWITRENIYITKEYPEDKSITKRLIEYKN